MRIKDIGITLQLESRGIDIISEKAAEYLSHLSLSREESIRLRLSIEEILLAWQAHFGTSVQVQMSCYSRLRQPTIRLRLKGELFDPMENRGDDLGAWTQGLLSRLETTPVYSYSRGANTVTLKVMQPRKNSFLILLYAIAAAIVVGMAGMLLPETIRLPIAEDWLTPICDTYLQILGFCGIPLIFLSVVLGILGVGDMNTLDSIGRKMVRHYLLVSLCAATAAAAVARPFFRFTMGGDISFAFTDALNMALGWLPVNLLDPFLSCNAMQLIIMGTFFGIALLKLDPLAKNLANVLDDLNSTLLIIFSWFTRLIPAMVFIALIRIIWQGQFSEVLPVWRSWVVTTGLQMTALAISFFWVCRKYQVKGKILLKKISTSFFIALGTNSCTATVPEEYACCGGKLGVDSKLFTFGIPIGASIFKPSCAIRMVVLSFYMAMTYQVPVSGSWFVITVLTSFLLSIAVPAIPGGALMFFPMLFTQLGIPLEVLPPMLATDIFFDAVCTACNQVSTELALVQQAGAAELLDVQMLRS